MFLNSCFQYANITFLLHVRWSRRREEQATIHCYTITLIYLLLRYVNKKRSADDGSELALLYNREARRYIFFHEIIIEGNCPVLFVTRNVSTLSLSISSYRVVIKIKKKKFYIYIYIDRIRICQRILQLIVHYIAFSHEQNCSNFFSSFFRKC